MKDDHLSREKLYAYDDGLLSAAEQHATEQHLADCAVCRERLAHSAAIVRALKAHLDGKRAPSTLGATVQQSLAVQDVPTTAHTPQLTRRLGLVSALGLLVLLTLVFSLWHPLLGAQPLVAQLAESHERLAREPQHIQVQGDATSVSAWLESMLHERITIPMLEQYRLEGALLESFGGQPAGHILYRQSNERSMSLLIWRGEVPTADLAQRDKGGAHFQVGTFGPETIVVWREDDLTYACVGDDSSDAMLEFAALIRRDESN